LDNVKSISFITDVSCQERPNVVFAHRSIRVALVSLVLGISGCVTPWVGQNAVPLPTSKAIPTANQPPVSREPADPTLDVPNVSVEQVSKPSEPIIRGQSPNEVMMSPGEDGVFREPMPASTAKSLPSGGVRVAQYDPLANPGPGPSPGPSYGAPQQPPPQYGGAPQYGGSAPSFGAPANDYFQGGYGGQSAYAQGGGGFSPPASAQGYGPSYSTYDGSGVATPYGGGPGYAPDGLLQPLPADYADLVVNLQETQTGRFMFGVGVNSDLGLTAQAIIDERNFDWRRWPRNLTDITNGTAWRGGGQSMRIEAVPGTQVQRYLINFTQPYLFDTLPISFNMSGFLFDRRYFDWDEERFGGRIGLGYRITPDLSLSVSLRGEQVDLHNARVRGIPSIERVLGESDLFSGKVALTHDTRDIPFAPTEGHYLELSYEQVFGSFDYPRANVDYRRYFLLRQRIDRSGRHTLGFSFKGGITGDETPVYENYFAGGYSTLRGFRFRHASPKTIGDVTIGGQLSLLGSAEYIFPITADDMLRGALFCDYGTVEEQYDNIEMDDFRVAIGAGLRINVPAMGPAPIAVDFAVPLAREGTDRIQNFSFFVGFGR